jgi:ankyrin repeat protein
LAVLQALVEHGGADVNAINGCGEWPLRLAAEANDVPRIDWLLSRNAEVDRTSSGETALHMAVLRDSREAVQRLLAAGADPNRPDCDGWTPLFGAQSREAIFALRKAGAKIDANDQIGAGPALMWNDPLLVSALTEPL